jgi:hypothetical protein
MQCYFGVLAGALLSASVKLLFPSDLPHKDSVPSPEVRAFSATFISIFRRASHCALFVDHGFRTARITRGKSRGALSTTTTTGLAVLKFYHDSLPITVTLLRVGPSASYQLQSLIYQSVPQQQDTLSISRRLSRMTLDPITF